MDCCDTCRFYSDFNIGEDRRCHRFPSPTKAPYSHWCGEFKTKTKKAGQAKFQPPTLTEVKEYAASIQFDLDCEKWMDHYKANGWKTGRVAMKDWQSAVRTWKKPDSPKAKSKDCVVCFAPYKVGFKYFTVKGKKKYRCDSCREKAENSALF